MAKFRSVEIICQKQKKEEKKYDVIWKCNKDKK